MRVTLSSLLLVLLVSACASGTGGTSAGGNPSQISTEQLRELDPEGLSAYQVVQRLRPNWLRTRATATFGAGASAPLPRGVMDGAPLGDVSDLERIRANEVAGMDFLSASDATTRFGTNYPAGAVLVRSR
jgi:hypothetical protein